MRKAPLVLLVLAVLAAVAAVLLPGTAATLVAAIVAGWLLCAAATLWEPRWGLLLTSLAGVGVSLYLTRQHLVVLLGESSICSINETFDCDAVNTSPYSEILGLPVALYGAAFYLGIGLMFWAWGKGRRDAAGALQLGRLAGLGAVLYSAFLAWVSHQMGTWCLFCISLYGLNAILLAGSAWALSRERAPGLVDVILGRNGERSLLRAGIAGLLALAVGAGVYGHYRTVLLGSASDPSSLARFYTTLPGPVELDGSEPQLGDPDAPYLIVEWADFQCPFCARMYAALERLVSEDPKVQVRFKQYPLNSDCNPDVRARGHPTACIAAIAAECAGRQGRFWDMARLLFANQHYQQDEDVRFMAQQLGLDMDAFEACRQDPSVVEGIHRDVEAARKIELTGTPTLVVRGLVGDGWVELRIGADGLAELFRAAESGVPLPPPSPREPGS